MTRQDQTPPKYDSLGGIFVKAPLRWRHLPRLVAFSLAVAGLLWLQWQLLQVHKKLPAVLPPIGKLMPDRAGVTISVFASMLVILAAWTVTWAIFPPSDQPLGNRMRSFLEWGAILWVYALILLAAQAIAGDTLRDYPLTFGLANSVLMIVLTRFHSSNRQRDVSQRP